MALTFLTLAGTDLIKVAEAFNRSFSDYFVPLHLSPEQLAEKMSAENVRLQLSAGAFDNEQLVGLILHGEDYLNGRKMAYNAGTGVIPQWRGQKLTLLLYNYCIPNLRKAGFAGIQLEVITHNIQAIRSYAHCGFEITRELICCRGEVEVPAPSEKFEVKALAEYDWPVLQSFWDFQPSWQSSAGAVSRSGNKLAAFGAFEGGQLRGYIIFNPASNRIQQLAVSRQFRKQGIGTQLLSFLARQYGSKISMINIDENARDFLAFLDKAGIREYLRQYEMLRSLEGEGE